MRIARKLVVATVGAASIALNIGQAHAVSIIDSPTGLSNPASTITFDERTFDEGTPITDQYFDLGVTFSPQVYYSTGFNYGNLNGSTVRNFRGGFSTPFSIRFTQSQTAAAFAAVTPGGTSTLTALLNGVPVETFSATIPDSESNQFYGFSDIIFDEINFIPGEELTYIDNIQIGTASAAVPFELSPGLGSAALAACGAIAYFKDNKKRKVSAKVFSKG